MLTPGGSPDRPQNTVDFRLLLLPGRGLLTWLGRSTTGPHPGSNVNSAWRRSGDISSANRGDRNSISTRRPRRRSRTEPLDAARPQRPAVQPEPALVRQILRPGLVGRRGDSLPPAAEPRQLDAVRILPGRFSHTHSSCCRNRFSSGPTPLKAESRRHHRSASPDRTCYFSGGCGDLEPLAGYCTRPCHSEGAVRTPVPGWPYGRRFSCEIPSGSDARCRRYNGPRIHNRGAAGAPVARHWFRETTFVRVQGGHGLGQPGAAAVSGWPAAAGQLQAPGRVPAGASSPRPGNADRNTTRPAPTAQVTGYSV